MPKGEKGTARPFLRGKIWYIRYRVPGENKDRWESSKSTDKNVAKRLLNERRKNIDDRQVSSTNATVEDLLNLYLADQRRQGRHSYQQADGYVRLHLKPAFGPIKAAKLESRHIGASSIRSRLPSTPTPPSTAGSRRCAAATHSD